MCGPEDFLSPRFHNQERRVGLKLQDAQTEGEEAEKWILYIAGDDLLRTTRGTCILHSTA